MVVRPATRVRMHTIKKQHVQKMSNSHVQENEYS